MPNPQSQVNLAFTMGDSSQYWPYERDAVAAGFEPEENPKISINNALLLDVRRDTSEYFANTLSITKSRLKHAKDLTAEANKIREEEAYNREASLKSLKDAKFELAYFNSQIKYGDDWNDTTEQVNRYMQDIQSNSDSVIYSHAIERAVDRFVEG